MTIQVSPINPLRLLPGIESEPLILTEDVKKTAGLFFPPLFAVQQIRESIAKGKQELPGLFNLTVTAEERIELERKETLEAETQKQKAKTITFVTVGVIGLVAILLISKVAK